MVAAVLFIVIACIVAVAFSRLYTTLKHLLEVTDNLVTDRNDLQNRVDALEFQQSAMQTECQRLTRELLKLQSTPSPATQPTVQPADSQAPTVDGIRYFGNVINSGQGYFRALLSTPDYTVKFTARADSADPMSTMLFEPVDLRTLLSNDGLDKAVAITGDVPADAAHDFDVIAPGVASLNGSRWVILSPCKIAFKR